MVTGMLKKGGRLLMRTQSTIISAAAIIAGTYGISAILGLVRSRLLASNFGASEELAVFYTADKIPSFIYSLIVVGTISTVFIPVFTNLKKRSKKSAWKTASSVVNASAVAFLFVGLLVYVFSPQIIRALSVWRFSEEQVILGARLMRIMICAQFILILSSFATCLLQSFKYFIFPAFAPVMYNIGMIVGIVFFSPKYGIYGPAIGVAMGSVLHMVIQLPMLKKINFDYRFALDIKDRGVREMLKLLPPRLFGSALVQISSIVNNSLAILVSTSSVVMFKFADQLQSFPINLFGASIALASLPTLSFEADGSNKKEFKRIFLTSFHQMQFLVIPASVIFLVLRVPLVRLVYGASRFPWEATVTTADVLAFFSLSIFAQSSVYLLTRAFYAMKDTVTPVKINFFTILFSTILSIIFVKFMHLGIWSVALSYSIAAVLDMIVLFCFLDRKVGGFGLMNVLGPFTKIGWSAALMGVSLYVPLKFLDLVVFDTTKTLPLIILTCVVAVAGMITYLFFTHIFRVEEVRMLYKLVGKLKFSKKEPPTQFTDPIQE